MISSIEVDNNGTKLAYIDSGVPSSGGVYSTIFAVHGTGFSNAVFNKVSAVSRSKGVRFVAINRRGYHGSTPFSDADKAVFAGTDSEKTEWLKQRAFEIANFIDAFIQREKLPAITPDGKSGGIALLGWSSGNALTAATIAHLGDLPSDVQARLASRFRAHIMQEPPSISFGLPLPPLTWAPEIDTTIPEHTRIPSFTRWITSYFQHGDLSTRDINVLEYVLPATSRVPSIYTMSAAEIADIVDEGPSPTVDTPFMISFIPQVAATYKTATFDKSVRARLPHLKIWEIVGDATASFSLAALWSIQDDDKAHGGNNVNYKMLPGLNHFMHWDEPEKTIEAYLEALA